MKTEQLNVKFYNHDQSWHHETLWKCTIHSEDRTATWPPRVYKVKVEIRRNAYDDQSYQRAYAFDHTAAKWNLIVNSPIKGAACYDVSYVCKDAKVALFHKDAEAVLKEVALILG